MGKSELRSKMLELIEACKQRSELTPEEKTEAIQLFKTSVLEDGAHQPWNTDEWEKIPLATKELVRRHFTQQPDSPFKARMLRLWELVDTRSLRAFTAEEKAELFKLIIDLNTLDESGEDQIAGR